MCSRSFCPAGTVYDAQLASAEEACIKERERCREEAEEHAKTRAQAYKLQVCASPADGLAGSSLHVLYMLRLATGQSYAFIAIRAGVIQHDSMSSHMAAGPCMPDKLKSPWGVWALALQCT